MCLLLSVNGKIQAVWHLWSGSLREQRKAEGDLATMKHPPKKNTSLPLGLQKRRLQTPRFFVALPKQDPCSLFKNNVPPHVCPSPPWEEPREK